MTTVMYYHEYTGKDGKQHERTLTFEFCVTPPTPGKYTGPPETCYPADGGDAEYQDVQDEHGAELFVDDADNGLIILWPGLIGTPDEIAPCYVDLEDLEEQAQEQFADDCARDYDDYLESKAEDAAMGW